MKRAPYAHIFILISFIANTLGTVPSIQAQELRLPVPGVMVALSPTFNPPILKGITVHPENPFKFDFILDKGDGNSDVKQESSKLVKYFLASLTTPENDLWVNLSPYEKDRIIPESFGQTAMGRDLLGEDYILKQVTASLIYPQGQIGREFWKRVYAQAAKRYGTTNIPINTFNKVWIVPDHAKVYEHGNTAYVVKATLKVMLEEDYLSMLKHQSQGSLQSINTIGSQVVREIVIPELTKEVNEGKNFAVLRQVYNSLILAVWFKKHMKDSILGRKYMDQNKVTGIHYDPLSSLRGPSDTEAIYQRYLKAFKKGVFNYIQEEPTAAGDMVPRKYFSGGFVGAFGLHSFEESAKISPAEIPDSAQLVDVDVNLADTAMMTRRGFLKTTLLAAASVGTGVSAFAQEADKKKTTILLDLLHNKNFQGESDQIDEGSAVIGATQGRYWTAPLYFPWCVVAVVIDKNGKMSMAHIVDNGYSNEVNVKDIYTQVRSFLKNLDSPPEVINLINRARMSTLVRTAFMLLGPRDIKVNMLNKVSPGATEYHFGIEKVKKQWKATLSLDEKFPEDRSILGSWTADVHMEFTQKDNELVADNAMTVAEMFDLEKNDVLKSSEILLERAWTINKNVPSSAPILLLPNDKKVINLSYEGRNASSDNLYFERDRQGMVLLKYQGRDAFHRILINPGTESLIELSGKKIKIIVGKEKLVIAMTPSNVNDQINLFVGRFVLLGKDRHGEIMLETSHWGILPVVLKNEKIPQIVFPWDGKGNNPPFGPRIYLNMNIYEIAQIPGENRQEGIWLMNHSFSDDVRYVTPMPLQENIKRIVKWNLTQFETLKYTDSFKNDKRETTISYDFNSGEIRRSSITAAGNEGPLKIMMLSDGTLIPYDVIGKLPLPLALIKSFQEYNRENFMAPKNVMNTPWNRLRTLEPQQYLGRDTPSVILNEGEKIVLTFHGVDRLGIPNSFIFEKTKGVVMFQGRPFTTERLPNTRIDVTATPQGLSLSSEEPNDFYFSKSDFIKLNLNEIARIAISDDKKENAEYIDFSVKKTEQGIEFIQEDPYFMWRVTNGSAKLLPDGGLFKVYISAFQGGFAVSNAFPSKLIYMESERKDNAMKSSQLSSLRMQIHQPNLSLEELRLIEKKLTKLASRAKGADQEADIQTALEEVLERETLISKSHSSNYGYREYIYGFPHDHAMLNNGKSGPGGIDLTAKRMNLEVASDKASAVQPMDLKALENIEINGLYIKDIAIKPLHNLPQLLGVSS